jgi:transaldolase
MKTSGVTNYIEFAKKFIDIVNDKPISFEVFADDHDEMFVQANRLSQLGDNVYVKIPIINTQSKSSIKLIKELIANNIKCNVTAVFNFNQIHELINNYQIDTDMIISIFAGRIADTGVDPIPLMSNISNLLKDTSKIKLLWASPRELLNICHAIQSRCNIITLPNSLLDKINSLDKDLDQFSLETVKMFYEDAKKSNFKI